MRKLILILAVVTFTGCALYPRNGQDFFSRRERARTYKQLAEKHGWYAPGDGPVIEWEIPVTGDPCLVRGRAVQKHWSSIETIKRWQKAGRWPVRKTEYIVFAAAGRCAP